MISDDFDTIYGQPKLGMVSGRVRRMIHDEMSGWFGPNIIILLDNHVRPKCSAS